MLWMCACNEMQKNDLILFFLLSALPQLLHSGIRMHSVEIILLDSIFAGYNKQTVVIKILNHRHNNCICFDSQFP